VVERENVAEQEPVARFAVPSTVLVQELPDQGLMFLHLGTEEYFGLDQVGTAMYQALLAHGTADAACDALLADYDVERDRLRADIQTFVDELVRRDLLVREPD
jgi:hypothetical protein